MRMNVTIINLTRFGDLLQSQAAIADIHAAGHQIDLVCLDNFAYAAQFLRYVRQTWPFPGSHLLERTSSFWPQALSDLAAFAQKVKAGASPDFVINLTSGAPARLLTRLLTPVCARVLGFDIDQYGFGVDHGVWTSFFSVAARKRVNSPFNLADMMRMMAKPVTGGMHGDFRLAKPDKNSMAWAAEFIKDVQGANGFIAFQLGASEERRRWPVSSFRELGKILWEKSRLVPILLGSPVEKALAEQYGTSPGHPFLNAIGATDLPKLAAILGRVRLLVTNDTGTMHLASGLGVTCLAFFLATAQPWDTGPMLPGCCCLEPALVCHPCSFGKKCERGEVCRQHISASTIARLILDWLETGAWHGEYAHDARVWLTARDARGFYELHAQSPAAVKSPGLWLAWMRVFWRQLFDDMDADPIEAPQGRLEAGFASLSRPDNAQAIAAALNDGAAVLDIIAECAPEIEKKPQLSRVFLRNCERLQSFWNKMSELDAISGFWHEFRSNQGDDMPVFGSRCAIMACHVRALANALNDQCAESV